MRVSYAVAVCLSVALTGCSLSPSAAPSPEAGAALTGVVHGGQQPVAGAKVYVYAAGTTGYGGASQSLLTSVPGTGPGTTQADSNGNYYTSTDGNGNFSITNAYSCTPATPGDQIYIYATGGNPGLAAGTNNRAIGLTAALGSCPSAGNFATATPFVYVNEVTTVAMQYAVGSFATDATHISSTTATYDTTAIANAFSRAGILASLGTGQALATTPAGNGTVPQAEIDTLANIIAACVNSNGSLASTPAATPCFTLFANATVDGTATGAQPTDTATAALYIAQNPSANIVNLCGLQTATAPFQPGLPCSNSGGNAYPHDFTIAINLTGGGLDNPKGLATDSFGNLFVANFGNNTISKFDPTGAPLTGCAGGLLSPWGIAIDLYNHLWVANSTYPGSIGEFDDFCNPISSYTGGGIVSPQSVATDGSGNVWTTSLLYDAVNELSPAGCTSWCLTITGATGYGLNLPQSVATDPSGNVYIANTGNPSSVTQLSSSGALIGTYTGHGISDPTSLVSSADGIIFVVSAGSDTITEIAPTATPGAPNFYTFATSTIGQPVSITLDPNACAGVTGNCAPAVLVANGNNACLTVLDIVGTTLSGFNYYCPAVDETANGSIVADHSGVVYEDWASDQGNHVIGMLFDDWSKANLSH
jgi:hypothetical protein